MQYLKWYSHCAECSSFLSSPLKCEFGVKSHIISWKTDLFILDSTRKALLPRSISRQNVGLDENVVEPFVTVEESRSYHRSRSFGVQRADETSRCVTPPSKMERARIQSIYMFQLFLGLNTTIFLAGN